MCGTWSKLVVAMVACLCWLGHCQSPPRDQVDQGSQTALAKRMNEIFSDGDAEAGPSSYEFLEELEQESVADDNWNGNVHMPRPPPSFVYIVSADSPKTIKLRGGILPNPETPGIGFSIVNHLQEKADKKLKAEARKSAYVSAYRTPMHAFLANSKIIGYLYKVQATKNMINIDNSLQSYTIDAGEYAVLGGIRYGQIVSWRWIPKFSVKGKKELNEDKDELYDHQVANTGKPRLVGYPVDSPIWNDPMWAPIRPSPDMTPEAYAEQLRSEAISFMESNDIGLSVGWRPGKFPLFDPPSRDEAKTMIRKVETALVVAREAFEEAKDAKNRMMARGYWEASPHLITAKFAAKRAMEQTETIFQLVNQNPFLGRNYFDKAWTAARAAVVSMSFAQSEVARQAFIYYRNELNEISAMTKYTQDVVKLNKLCLRSGSVIWEVGEMIKESDALERIIAEHKHRISQFGQTTPEDEVGLHWLRNWEHRSVAVERELKMLGHKAIAVLPADAQDFLERARRVREKALDALDKAKAEARKVEEARKAKEAERARKTMESVAQKTKEQAVQGLEQQAAQHEGSSWSKSASFAAGGLAGIGIGAFGLAIHAAIPAAGAAGSAAAGPASGAVAGAASASTISAEQFSAGLVQQVAETPVEVAAADVEELLADMSKQVTRKGLKGLKRVKGAKADKVPLLADHAKRSVGLAEDVQRFWRDAAMQAAMLGGSMGYERADVTLKVPW
ncbi:putative enterotoxin [Ophiocordyceps australis]|uniref:Putative enterotoxin n=1 Tax=Ophiocordyceps australis TaxID=1399860 RepID=A0A2C5ZQ46_9HYPO|nr:putative enterotoxin [Ophiocordyceps australis]